MISILHKPQGVPRVNSAAFVARAMHWTPAQRLKIVVALTKRNLF